MVVLKKSPPPTEPSTDSSAAAQATTSTMGHPNVPYRDDPEAAEAPSPPPYSSSHWTIKRSRTTRRFLGGFLIAIAILLFVGFFFDYRHDSHPPAPEGVFPYHVSPPPSSEGRPGHTASWSEPVHVPYHPSLGGDDGSPWYSSTANFTLPYTEATHLLFLRSFQNSDLTNIKVITDPSLKGRDEIKVGVEAIFHETSVRDALWVGELTQDAGDSRGVGIKGWSHSDVARWMRRWTIDVYVHLVLPPKDDAESDKKSVSMLPAMEIKADASHIHWSTSSDHPALAAKSVNLVSRAGSMVIDNLEADDQVQIQSSAGSIHAENSASEISARAIDIEAHGGSIKGRYRVVDSLAILSHAGSIGAKVSLPGKPKSPGSNKYKQSNPTVSVNSHAGSVQVEYLSQHPSVELHSEVSSLAGSVTVDHHPNYQGTFDLVTNAGSLTYRYDASQKTVQVDGDRKNPAGRDVKGRVWREDDDDGKDGGEKWSKKGASIAFSRAGSLKVTL